MAAQAARRSDGIVVVHSVRHWLPRTKTWIHEQLQWLPSSIEAHVVCDHTENLDEFPFSRLHVSSRASRLERGLDYLGRRTRTGALRSLARISERLSASILHSHFGPEAWRELPAAQAAGLRQVVTFYGYDVTRVPQGSPRWHTRYRELFSHVDRILCEGPHMREQLLRLGAPSAQVLVHHLGVDLQGIAFAPRAWRSGEPLNVLLAAAFREKKGLPYALRALAEVQRQRPDLELHVSVIGDASADPADQREKQLILETAASLASERVRFLGFQPHQRMFEVAAEHHIFLSPSVRAQDGDTEGGAPVTLIELAASGMPIVSSTHCDIPNVLRGPASRLLAPERDVTGLAERLGWLIDHPDEWPALLRFVRDELSERFDSRRQAQQLAAIYRELPAPRRATLALRTINRLQN